jgi:hypothetical protein
MPELEAAFAIIVLPFARGGVDLQFFPRPSGDRCKINEFHTLVWSGVIEGRRFLTLCYFIVAFVPYRRFWMESWRCQVAIVAQRRMLKAMTAIITWAAALASPR